MDWDAMVLCEGERTRNENMRLEIGDSSTEN